MARAKLVAPSPISKLYSEVDMQMELVDFEQQDSHCPAEACDHEQTFEQRVEDTGGRLAQAAFGILPELGERVEQFEFVVADKNKPGSTSNASGKIVIFRGVSGLNPDDIALSFLIAREMGRVIGQHHDENSATRILVSVIAGVLFPASNLFSTTAVSQTAYSSTLAATAASTATSLLGSKLALDSLKPEQLTEADTIALGLLDRIGIKPHQVAISLAQLQKIQNKDGWARDFDASAERVRGIKEISPENSPTLAETPVAAPPKPVQLAALDSPTQNVQLSPAPLDEVEPVGAEPETIATENEISVAVAPATGVIIKAVAAQASTKTMLPKKERTTEKFTAPKVRGIQTTAPRLAKKSLIANKQRKPVQMTAKAMSRIAAKPGKQSTLKPLAKSVLHDPNRIKKSIKATSVYPPKPAL